MKEKSLLSITFFLIFTFITIAFYSPLFAITSNEQYKALSKLEQTFGGRLGISALDTATGSTIQYRANERFPFASTGKLIAVAAMLKASMEQPGMLDRKIHFTQQDLITAQYTPVTQKHLETGMNIADLSAAAITESDNAAMNLIITKLGGPEKITQFARSIVDNSF